MEWLGHFIQTEIDSGKWDPIHLSRTGPSVSHLFFADDLVIFCKAQLDQAHLLDSILTQFCEISGHQISVRKSNIFFSKDTEANVRIQINQLFGFQEVRNLGTYLGVPLLHERITKSTLSFIVDKVRKKLQSWDARKLSIAGRITLAQSILLSIPNYFMQSLMIPKGVSADIERLVRQFIWGNTDGQPKMSLVGWNSICQPRSRGGLGFRHLEDQNSSFLMKIGFNLASKSNVFWVRVLRAKYGWKDQFPDSINRSQCSHLWRALSKIWPLLRENIAWSIGDGATARCWKDPWIPGMGPLISKIFHSANLDLDCCVREMVNSDGSWNLDLFHAWVPEDIINRIISIPPPHPDSGPDRIIWAPSASGAFSVRSAYWYLKENSWNPQEDYWKIVWKYPGPQRRLSFRARCVAACDSRSAKTKDYGLMWSCLFGLVAWRLWKNRNLFIFQHISWTASEVVKVSSCWGRHYTYYVGDHFKSKQGSSLMVNSDDNWVFLFSDGAVARDSGYAAIGGMARDRDGNWIVGFNRFLGILSDMDLEDSGITMIRRTLRILHSEGEWRINHIPRNHNLVADRLAKLSLSWKSSLQVMDEAPKDILDLLQVDKTNGCFM
ncbi:uncharacterized protein LOC105801186 [Gossypium raimondii]|uniref:uncharacterized protein LOC105801186 n=1 Tax=Gossypium raimondii TaxID=29730 RepID=UPI00063ACA44|nr:uncharacterized protein LOC105801186 [Gossypium raimondii]